MLFTNYPLRFFVPIVSVAEKRRIYDISNNSFFCLVNGGLVRFAGGYNCYEKPYNQQNSIMAYMRASVLLY